MRGALLKCRTQLLLLEYLSQCLRLVKMITNQRIEVLGTSEEKKLQ